MGTDKMERWREIDAWGKKLSDQIGALDVEIGDWLIAAREAEIHIRVGLGTFLEYAERRLKLDAHAASERLRVAEVLVGLPDLREALLRGERSWSVVRELTRVATPETEAEWLAATDGKRVREVERMVSGRRPGQTPRDPVDARAQRHVLRFEVSAEAYALFREAVRVMRREVDPSLSEEQVLGEMARRALGGPADEGRSPYQVALTICEGCGRGWQDARGEKVDVPAEVIEKAACDAQRIGRLDPSSSSSHGGRARASQTIPPAVRREVLRRDGGRCRVPGCASSTWIELHHLKLRSEGGDHDPSRVFCLCGAHHGRLHEGLLLVEGESIADLTFRHADGSEYGKSLDTGEIALHAAAYGALRHLGFRETESKRALAEVRSRVGRGATLEEVIRLALRVATDRLAAA